jgi:predicted RNase H-like HicB family nuclease
MPSTYTVRAEWDPEASVWVATSDDVLGLCAEAPTVEELTLVVLELVP